MREGRGRLLCLVQVRRRRFELKGAGRQRQCCHRPPPSPRTHIRQGQEEEALFSDLMSVLTMLGQEGWEVIQAQIEDPQDSFCLLLKRPVG